MSILDLIFFTFLKSIGWTNIGGLNNSVNNLVTYNLELKSKFNAIQATTSFSNSISAIT